MARLATGSSNISNAGARAKARKASLIDSTRIRQLLQQGTDSIGASIGELGYRQEMDLYSTRMSGSDAIEAALTHNLDNDLNSVLGFCQGNLRDLVAIYVERFQYEKVKTVLRSVSKGASDEMIADQILPEENPSNSFIEAHNKLQVTVDGHEQRARGVEGESAVEQALGAGAGSDGAGAGSDLVHRL